MYPKTCLSCEKLLRHEAKDSFVCPQCRGKIKKNLPPFCQSCGRQLEKRGFSKNICPLCQKKKLHFDRAFSPCIYEGTVKELIHGFKYKNKDYLGQTLSKLMAEYIDEYLLPFDYLDLVIPVPLHKTKLREREFNQAQILGGFLAQRYSIKLDGEILVRHRNTRTQTELPDCQRQANVRGSFSVCRKQALKGKNILLIDDVLTTGATASEAAFALKEAGANIVFVCTLAN
ncbi:MAG: ComF family protein [Candidatus Omnitrophica bacterium]|nr:ComF family protein [Candidatus Omnitrophota bacterium]